MKKIFTLTSLLNIAWQRTAKHSEILDNIKKAILDYYKSYSDKIIQYPPLVAGPPRFIFWLNFNLLICF